MVEQVNNTIYAFDADVSGAPLPDWKIYAGYTRLGSRPHSYADTAQTLQDMHPSFVMVYYYDSQGNMGIVGTPVIDKPNGTMYFVTKIVNGNPDNHPWKLTNCPFDEYTYGTSEFHWGTHAVDITNGAEKQAARLRSQLLLTEQGTTIKFCTITFDPRRHFNRSGLALSNGIVYIAYAAHCDFNPSHGWLLGYNACQRAWRDNSFTLQHSNDGRGNMWMSGSGPAIDANGSIYFTTGNLLDEQFLVRLLAQGISINTL